MLTRDRVIQICTTLSQLDRKFWTQGSKTLKPILKNFYCLVCSYLSYDVSQEGSCARAQKGFQIKYEDTMTLSHILFEELRRRLSFSSDDMSMSRDVKQAVFHVDVRDSVEEVLLLLRCCFLMVRLHPYDNSLMDEFQNTVPFLRRLSSRDTSNRTERGPIQFNEVISCQNTCGRCTTSFSDDVGGNSCDPCLHLLKRMLEVFLDEVFVDRFFREHIAKFHFFSFNEVKVNRSMCSSLHFESVLDIIAAHLLLSVNGEHTLQTFIRSLFWTEKQTLFTPELSLTAAVSLVKHPVMMSAPNVLFVHVISLVSEVIGIRGFPEMVGPNVRYMEIYLSLFDYSVNLYFGHMSKLLRYFRIKSFKPDCTVRRTLPLHFHSEIYDSINVMLLDWDKSWRAQTGNMFTKSNSSLASDAISYLKMNMCIFDESKRGAVFSFLSSLITRVFVSEVDENLLCRAKEMTFQDFCLLASILKLMSCSMLQAICCLEKCLSCSDSSSKNKDAPPEHMSLVRIMGCFGDYNLPLPIEVQHLIDDALKPHLLIEDSKLMFEHFACLLSVCFVSGLDFLVYGCLFTMMVVMNLLILGERNLDKLNLSVISGPELRAAAFSPADVTSVVTNAADKGSFGRAVECRIRKKSSLKVASNFQRIRQLTLRNQAGSEDEEEFTDGEAYLRLFTNNLDDIAELADFITCKPGKDYKALLRNSEKFRYRKYKRFARRQWQKKKKVFNSMGSGKRRV